jgi:hypothetical protein
MAVYGETREEVEDMIREGYERDGKMPRFFGKIILFGAEKWIIGFEARDHQDAAFRIIEDLSDQIREILSKESLC